jgi:tetratricopeptide (TPR) repeat protein
MTTEGWVDPMLRFLALRREEDLRHARRLAPGPVADFLEAFQAEEAERAVGLFKRLASSGLTTREEVTVEVALTDLFARVVEMGRGYPPELMLTAREMAIDASRQAVGLARQLGNQPCVALYLRLLGVGSWESGSKRAAREAYGESLAIYRELVKSEPGVYRPSLAGTLDNLGAVLSDLNETRAARAALEEALAIHRELAASEPGVYRPDVALTLNNLGTVLSDLNEKRTAREVYEEALAVYRELAGSEPGIYRPFVAGTLNNLGNVLRDLNERRAAREAFDEALAIYRELARPEPGVYRPDVAITLNNLGTVLSDLNEKQAALGAYEEAERIHSSLGLSLGSARLSALFSNFEAAEGGESCDRALELARKAVQTVEGLLSGLQQPEHAAVTPSSATSNRLTNG